MSIKEKRLKIDCGEIYLESLFHNTESSLAAIITHPHPLYGGSMYNNVVHDAVKAFAASGITTLRFNFRGVGSSTGKYGEGIEEREDFLAAFTFLKKIQSIPSILPVGYSFGSYVIYHSLNQIEEKCAVIFIAPPVDVMDFGENEALKQHQFFIITGESDEYCSPRSAEKLALRLDAQLTVFPQIDHFFRGESEKLQGEITRCINMFCTR